MYEKKGKRTAAGMAQREKWAGFFSFSKNVKNGPESEIPGPLIGAV